MGSNPTATAKEFGSSDSDPEKSQRAMQAMMAMGKLDIDALERAHQGG